MRFQKLKNTETKVVFVNSTTKHRKIQIINNNKKKIDDWNLIKCVLNAANRTLKSEIVMPRKSWIAQ